MRTRIVPFLALAAMLLSMTTAHAVQIAGDDGLVHTANPGDGTPWANVGTISGSSGIYLGGYGSGHWVLTAAHVVGGNADGKSMVLNGSTYNAVAGSGVRLLNANSSLSDLMMFRLSSDPGLSNLTINSTALNMGGAVRMIGNGTVRQANQTFWDVNGTTWTELPGSAGAEASGYKHGGSRAMAWGDNNISSLNQSVDVGYGATTTFGVTFDALHGDAHAAVGDSGGAVFMQSEDGWMLAGVMDAVGGFGGQPAGTSVFGNVTYSADLSYYYSQIQGNLSAVPEPSTYALMAGGAGLAAIGVRRRRRRVGISA